MLSVLDITTHHLSDQSWWDCCCNLSTLLPFSGENTVYEIRTIFTLAVMIMLKYSKKQCNTYPERNMKPLKSRKTTLRHHITSDTSNFQKLKCSLI